MEYKVYCQHDIAFDQLSIYVFQNKANGMRAYCTDLSKMVFEDIPEAVAPKKPTLQLKGFIVKPFLQAFANELANIGIMAEGKPVLENELSAVKYHLEDMRKLVFSVDKKE